MEYFACVVIGIILGIAIVTIHSKLHTKEQKPKGAIMVNTSDPDGPYLFLKSYVDIDTLLANKHVVLEIDIKNDSQK